MLFVDVTYVIHKYLVQFKIQVTFLNPISLLAIAKGSLPTSVYGRLSSSKPSHHWSRCKAYLPFWSELKRRLGDLKNAVGL